MDPYNFGLYCYIGVIPTGSACMWYLTRLIIKQLNRRHIRAAEANGWKYIGEVEFMCIYPIDGGQALKRNNAYIGQFGLRDHIQLDKAYHDRTYILYSKVDQAENEISRAILNNPKVSKTHIRQPGLKELLRTLQTHSDKVNQTKKLIQYLAGTMSVADMGDPQANQVKKIFNLPDPNVRIGHYPQNERNQFNENMKINLLNLSDPSYCLTNYSSYTIVNSASIEKLRTACDRTDLSYMNFRPQIVFKGKEPYIEDGIRALRIGNLEFSEVSPCIHSRDVNFTFKSRRPRNRVARMFMGERSTPEREETHTQPYDYLMANRQICKYYSNFADIELPTFGVNFEYNEVCGNAENAKYVIRKGYNVYVKYYSIIFVVEKEIVECRESSV